MEAKRIIKRLLRLNNLTMEQLARKAGYASQSGISAILARRGMSVDILCKLVGAMGSEVLVRMPDGTELVVTPAEREEV